MRTTSFVLSVALLAVSSVGCVRDATQPGTSYDSKPQGDESARQSERADENKAVNEATHTNTPP